MNYSIDGMQSEQLKEAAEAVKAELKSLKANNKQTKEIKLQISELTDLHETIKKGELFGLLHATSFLLRRLPALEKPKRGGLLKHKKKKWAYDDLQDLVSMYAARTSPYMIFHDQQQLSAIGAELEKVVSKWDRGKVNYNCVIHMIRTEYLGQKSELLERRIKQLEQQISTARDKEYEHGEQKARGRQKQFDPRDNLYRRVINSLTIELGRELTSTDYLSFSRRVLKEDGMIKDTTLRSAFERLTGCKPTSKKHVTKVT